MQEHGLDEGFGLYKQTIARQRDAALERPTQKASSMIASIMQPYLLPYIARVGIRTPN